MIEDIAWFELDQWTMINGERERVKVLKVRINGEWHIVQTIPINPA